MDEKYDNWTEVADEDLWEDGELSKMDVAMKLFDNIVSEGKWIVLRRLRRGESMDKAMKGEIELDNKNKKLEGSLEQCWECSAIGPIKNFYTLERNNEIEYYCDVCIKRINLS